MRKLFGIASLLCLACGATPAGPPKTPEISKFEAKGNARCLHYDPLRRPLFGDLHVHTSYSMDAYVFDTRTTPDGAYRFAQGESIQIAPLDAQGRPTRQQQIDRPLDFAAVTDHAENFGSVALCTREDSPVYDSASCQLYRGQGDLGVGSLSFLETVRFVTRRMSAVDSDEVCGADGRRCRDAGAAPWHDIQEAARNHYDDSPECAFTTFVAYEYSLSPELSKVHRNIIFRGDTVIDRPIDALSEPEPLIMLRRLRDECVDGMPGCDVLSIPHNPNLSDGRMFRSEYPGVMNTNQEARFARLRAQMEPVIEIMQIKGDSECRNGFPGVSGDVDELCDFEKMRAMQAQPSPDCEGEIGAGSLAGKGCVDRRDFARYALIAGLAEEKRIGANPFRFGLAASTDEHDGTMGDVAERTYGSPGTRESQRFNTNPGGLIAVYAEENRREAIFDAISRREVYGTSGPRITARFFGGWDFDPGLCEDPQRLAKSYAQGVPMGALLPAPPRGDDAKAQFLVSALRDPGLPDRPGGRLERLQIIKGWVGENDIYEQRIYDVAGTKHADSEVLDLERCEPSGAGHDSLCALWSDPDFDPAQAAVYYARVVEMPSCRWSARVCNQSDESARPAQCDDPLYPRTIRERAWTSPIWYSQMSEESRGG